MAIQLKTPIEIVNPKVLQVVGLDESGQDEYGYVELPEQEIYVNYSPTKKTFMDYITPDWMMYDNPPEYEPGYQTVSDNGFVKSYSLNWANMHDGKEHPIYEGARSGHDDVANTILTAMSMVYGGSAARTLTSQIMKSGLGPKVATILGQALAGTGVGYAQDTLNNQNDLGKIGNTNIPFKNADQLSKMTISELESLRDELDNAINGTGWKNELARLGISGVSAALPWTDKILHAFKVLSQSGGGTKWRIAGSVVGAVLPELIGRGNDKEDLIAKNYLQNLNLYIVARLSGSTSDLLKMFDSLTGNIPLQENVSDSTARSLNNASLISYDLVVNKDDEYNDTTSLILFR